MQPTKFICIFTFLLYTQHVSALAGHHQLLLFMLKLSNCIAYNFYLVLLYINLRYSSTKRKRQHQHAGGENEEQGQTYPKQRDE
jgi:hypothetical protein